ncbi:MAG TPA: nickel pincer cofactor biosynthesis protein LarB [Clostridiales bacterium]|nr:nickel pincer cofactor biosynthesis protein LarB [Clostridiales bacterium]HBR08745.1 nickel pincer cofactor biosynthesis protein LarB [Clostridiales bacterium]
MSSRGIREILKAVEAGSLSAEAALLKLKLEPFADINYAKVDGHRAVRQGISEVIYGAGKTPDQIIGIAEVMVKSGQETVLITRMNSDAAAVVGEAFPLRYSADCRIGIIGRIPEPDGRGDIVVATGGTTDIPVAEEAALTAEALGNRVSRLYDVGVSGIHRLLAHLEMIMSAQAIVAVAGMEGALASVVGGLADCPVIAVPTSVGYGAAFGGVAALLSMLNSCAAGVSVVNIDNGFGAGCLASMINHIGV